MKYRDIETNKGSARLYRGFTQGNIPKTYEFKEVISHDIGNNYNSSILRLYTAKDKTLRYEIYRDGNMFPYYGKFEYLVY